MTNTIDSLSTELATLEREMLELSATLAMSRSEERRKTADLRAMGKRRAQLISQIQRWTVGSAKAGEVL